MRKKMTALLALLLCAAMLTGCAYLPTLGITSLYDGTSQQTAAAATQSPAAQTEEKDTETVTASADDTKSDSDTVTISREQYERYQQFDELLEIMDEVQNDYYQEVDTTKLLEGAATGMLDAVGDPYTFYYTPEAYADLWEDDEGEYAGIGIQITSYYATNLCIVSRVFTGTPAEAAGVHKGDILYRVGEDLLVVPDTVDEAVSIMRGTPGTTVDVTFLRDGEELTFTIERAVVNTNWVESGMLTDEVGYIILYQFAGDCSEKFIAAADELVAQGAKGIILDLRDNPGGWVNDAVAIADYFLPKGVVCTAQYRSGYEYVYRTTTDGKEPDVELVVLINESSASSSEILTGCLKDRTDVTVVGTTSYGKGIIQAVLPVGSNGAGMQLTIAQYFTPNGNAMHKIGITPDVEVELAEDDNGMHDFGDLTDAQLAKALEVMQEKLAAK